MTNGEVESLGPEKPKRLREIVLVNWVPALLTAIVGGLVAAGFVPLANNYFESGRVLQDRRTRVVEAVADAFAGAVANTGKIRALEEALAEAVQARKPLADGSAGAKALDEKIERWRKELRETEIALYTVNQRVNASLTLAKLLFEPKTASVIDGYLEWRRQQKHPITAEQLREQSNKVLGTLVKEMRR